jgi:hypothetical protein
MATGQSFSKVKENYLNEFAIAKVSFFGHFPAAFCSLCELVRLVSSFRSALPSWRPPKGALPNPCVKLNVGGSSNGRLTSINTSTAQLNTSPAP